MLLCAALPADAQKFQPRTIQFKGAPEYSDAELLDAAELKKGTVLEFADMQEHAQRLISTGVFGTVNFKFDGVDLIFNLVPATTLYPIRLENLPLVPGKELDAKLHDRFPLYHGKVPSEAGMLEGVRGALEELLAAQGIKATVIVVPFTDQKLAQVTAMSYVITAPPVRVGEISLHGVSPELQAKVKDVAASAMKADFSTENASGNIERAFASLYGDEGYAAVKVHAEPSGNPVAGSEAINVPFNVSIEEGRHYKLGSIHLPSGELVTLEGIDKAAGADSTRVQKMSIKGGLTIHTAVLFALGEYKSKGYMDCVVTPHPQFDEALGIVNYSLEVQPGPVYTMGKLTIENGADDLRAAMLAAWKLPMGTPFSEKAIHDYFSSQSNQTALGRTFASVNCKYRLVKNIETHTVDVTLRLERKN